MRMANGPRIPALYAHEKGLRSIAQRACAPVPISLAEEVQEIIKAAEDLDSPWRERVLALTQDWIGMLSDDMSRVSKEIGLARALELGGQTVAQLEVIEEMLELPLCAPCKELIGGKVAE